jgi:hypothetical protein
MAVAKKKAAPAKGAWVPPWAKKAAPAKAGAKKSMHKKSMGGSSKNKC